MLFKYSNITEDMEQTAGGRTRIYFVHKGKEYNRYIHTDKNGKKYVYFLNKKIDLYKLKNYGKIEMEVTSMHPSSPNYHKSRKEDYKPHYTRNPSYW